MYCHQRMYDLIKILYSATRLLMILMNPILRLFFYGPSRNSLLPNTKPLVEVHIASFYIRIEKII